MFSCCRLQERHADQRLLDGRERVHEAGRSHGASHRAGVEDGSHVAAVVFPESGQMSLTVRPHPDERHDRLRSSGLHARMRWLRGGREVVAPPKSNLVARPFARRDIG